MTGRKSQNDSQSLADIEKGLIEAEQAFADANARFEEAQRDREAALDTISLHQSAFDEAVADLRRRSMPGSKWQREMGEADDILVLRHEHVAKDDADASGSKRSRNGERDDAGALAHLENDGPVIKIAAGSSM